MSERFLFFLQPDCLPILTVFFSVYPNLMINRYGPWMDTNVVTPTGPNTCVVHFDYFVEAGEFLFISVWAISMTSCFVHRLTSPGG